MKRQPDFLLSPVSGSIEIKYTSTLLHTTYWTIGSIGYWLKPLFEHNDTELNTGLLCPCSSIDSESRRGAFYYNFILFDIWCLSSDVMNYAKLEEWNTLKLVNKTRKSKTCFSQISSQISFCDHQVLAFALAAVLHKSVLLIKSQQEALSNASGFSCDAECRVCFVMHPPCRVFTFSLQRHTLCSPSLVYGSYIKPLDLPWCRLTELELLAQVHHQKQEGIFRCSSVMTTLYLHDCMTTLTFKL